MEKEFGDLMFSLINFSRFVQIDPEAALEKTNKKFIQRFLMMEDIAKQQQRSLHDMTLQEMDTLWNKAKEVFK
jgi:XTP/dITP diphosphohydrolase